MNSHQQRPEAHSESGDADIMGQPACPGGFPTAEPLLPGGQRPVLSPVAPKLPDDLVRVTRPVF